MRKFKVVGIDALYLRAIVYYDWAVSAESLARQTADKFGSGVVYDLDSRALCSW